MASSLELNHQDRLPDAALQTASLSVALLRRANLRAASLNYWRSLTHQKCPDPCLYPGLVDELQAALRDALRIIHTSQRSQETTRRWRGACTPQREWTGKC
ncbi:hypothetical protein HAP94_00350 [Acidithiobacillus ferrivorans]|nr:hypothetical protein [Acidithiobacillus ferrivorans]